MFLNRLSCISTRRFQLSSKFLKRTRNPVKEAEGSLAGQVIPGYSLGAKLTGGAAVLSLGGLCFYGLNLGGTDRAIDRAGFWPKYVRDRVSATYSYLFQSLCISGVAAYGALQSPAVMSVMARGGMISLIATIGCMIGLQMATRSSPYVQGEGNWTKKAFWAAHSAFLGCFIAPLVAMYGDVVAQAALYTAGITGGISLIGWTAPSRAYMNMAGPMAMGAGCLFVAMFASPFMSPTSPAGGALFSFLLWGGMIFSGAMIYMHTQKMLDQAEHHPGRYGGRGDYDPINASLGLHIAIINMFQRMIFLLGMNKRK